VTAPLAISFDVACPPARAFDVWTTRIATWWPTDHSVTQDPDLTVVLEEGVGGRIYERTVGGDEYDWGVVTVWEPPGKLAYQWHLGRDAADATDVEIRFHRLGAGRYPVEISTPAGNASGPRPTPGGSATRSVGRRCCRISWSHSGQEGLMQREPVRRRPVGADHAPRQLVVFDVPRRGGRPTDPGVPGRLDHPHVPPPGGRRPPRVARRAGDWVPLGRVRREEGGRRWAPSRRGADPRTIRSEVGTACATATAGASACTPPLLEALGLAEVTHDPRKQRPCAPSEALRPSPATIKEGDQCQPPEWSATGPSPSTPTRMSA